MKKEEIELLKDIQVGDCKAFRQLYENYIEVALRVATGITKDRNHGADAVHETFMRVYNNIHSFDLNKPFEPWFYKILINECRRILGNKGNKLELVDYLEDTIGYSHHDKYFFEEYHDLYNAVAALEEVNRIPIILKYLKGYSEKEIAEVLGVKVNTIKSRLFRGRQRLRTLLEK